MVNLNYCLSKSYQISIIGSQNHNKYESFHVFPSLSIVNNLFALITSILFYYASPQITLITFLNEHAWLFGLLKSINKQFLNWHRLRISSFKMKFRAEVLIFFVWESTMCRGETKIRQKANPPKFLKLFVRIQMRNRARWMTSNFRPCAMAEPWLAGIR